MYTPAFKMIQQYHLCVCIVAALAHVSITKQNGVAFAFVPSSTISNIKHQHVDISYDYGLQKHKYIKHSFPVYNLHASSLLSSAPRPSSAAKSQHYNHPLDEPRTTHKVTIDLPLGIILEEMDATDPSLGVVIIGINDDGNAARYNTDIFSKIKSLHDGNTINCHNDCICIRDKIISVNDTPCHDKGFDDVIDIISSITESSKSVTIELGRLQGSTVINYYNGTCIAAKEGESYGFLADKCGITDVQYECRTGNCQTCARWMEFPDKERDVITSNGGEEDGKKKVNLYERTILHCVGRMPRGYQWLHVLEPYYKSDEK